MADTMCFRDIPTPTMFTLQAKYMQIENRIQLWTYSYLDTVEFPTAIRLIWAVTCDLS